MCLRQIVVVSLLACGFAGSAHADERAWFLSNNSLTEVEVTAGGRQWTPISSVTLPPHTPISPILWRGGRYILWFASRPEGHWFVRFDTRTRQLAAFPVPFVAWSMAVDRETAWIVVLASSAVYLVDVEQLRIRMEFPLPPPQPTESRSLAVAGAHIFVGRTTADGSIEEVLVFSRYLNSQVLTIPGVWYAQVSRDEQLVYLQTRWPVEVQVWDGFFRLLHTGPADGFVHAVGDMIASEYRIPGLFSTGVRLSEYDRTSLNVVFQANVDVYSRPLNADYVLELQQPAAWSPIVLRSHTNEYGVNFRVIQVFDRVTRAPIREMRNASFDPVGSKLLMLAAPDPPSPVHAVINGENAILTWQALPNVGEYEVVVGTAPGLSDVGTFPTGGVPFARFSGLPFGTFYVRVRAINELGAVEGRERPIYVPDWGGFARGVNGPPTANNPAMYRRRRRELVT